MATVDTTSVWDGRHGLVHFGTIAWRECVRRLQRLLPTVAHAERLVGVLLDELGPDGRGDPYTDGTRIAVMRADPAGWWCRRPVAVLHHGRELVETEEARGIPQVPTALQESHAQDPKPEIAPEGLARATLGLWSGRAVLEDTVAWLREAGHVKG